MNICRHTLGKFKGKKYASKQKKKVLSKSSLKEPIGFKIIMSTIRVKFLEGKEENYFFNCIFNLAPYRSTPISSVRACWMHK
jgi:hypothetical protein